MKRLNVLSWDDYFMGLAHLSALRSKDPSTQVGAWHRLARAKGRRHRV